MFTHTAYAIYWLIIVIVGLIVELTGAVISHNADENDTFTWFVRRYINWDFRWVLISLLIWHFQFHNWPF
jgi:hypothetical protein